MPVTVRHLRHPLAAALVTVQCATIVLCSTPQVLAAQNAQPYAAQLSALFTTIRAGNSDVAGAGVEVQQRFNRLYATEAIGAVSLGLGGQYTVHTKVQDRLSILASSSNHDGCRPSAPACSSRISRRGSPCSG